MVPKHKKKGKQIFADKPLVCGNFETKEKPEEKWLGQIISSAGFAASVSQTVAAKESKIKGAC